MLKKTLLATLLLLAAACGLYLVPYFQTDFAYERMARAEPTDRVEVEALLPGFRGHQVNDPTRMQPILRSKAAVGMEYWRYQRYPGFPIDVVNGEDGSVVALWPQYE